MKFLFGLAGANVPVIKDFQINGSTKIEAGELVRISSDGNIAPDCDGSVIGVAAEEHSGTKDILNARADGERVRIDITNGGVYEVDAPCVVANADGTATTLVCSAGNLNSSLSGVKLVLKEKGENSLNTDSVGDVRKVQRVSVSGDTATFVLDEKGVTGKGDIYAVIPCIGFEGNVADDNKGFVISGTSDTKLKVVCSDTKTLKLGVTIGSKLFEA